MTSTKNKKNEPIRVLFVFSGNNQHERDPIIYSQGESLAAKGVDLHYFPIRGKGLRGYGRNIFKLRRHLRQNHYDILHAHYGLSGWLTMIARMRKHKVIISFMGNDLNGNVNRKNILSLASRLQLSINHTVARFCTFAIVKSNRLSAHLDKIVNKAVIPNGVDLDRFYPADRAAVRRELGWSDDSRYFLFLADPGRPEKNFPMVENAFRSIRDEKIRLVVRFDIAHAELYRYLSAADGLILASFQEGSPNVVKEAMACNCPVIATDVGDVAEVIGDTQGCHITGFDPEELAGKIQTVAGDGTRTRGRERILELGLDSGSIADRILGIYKQVLNKK